MPLISFKKGVAKKYEAAGINVKQVGKGAKKKKAAKKATKKKAAKRKGSTTKDSRAPKKSKAKEKPVEIMIEEEEEELSLLEILEKAGKADKLTIERVTKATAPKIQKELTKSYIKELSDDRVKANFVYDYFSHVAGMYLPGASKLKGKKPPAKEYSTSNKKANFFWAGIKIFVLRNSKSKKIKDLLIFHNAYLTSNPGPDASHHDNDPVMRKTKTGSNFASKVGNAHLGSKTWAETPVMVGEDIDLMIALALAECAKENLLVATDGEGYDDDLIDTLKNWGFKKVYMTHPKTGKAWLEEEGKDELHIMFRSNQLTEKEIYKNFQLKKPASKKKMKVVKATKKTKASFSSPSSRVDSRLEKKVLKLEAGLEKKDKAIAKLKAELAKMKKKFNKVKSSLK